jgi:3,4-dihydroxy 2-butanone 4-phosphate synthase/GTP cyclohydrolase II
MPHTREGFCTIEEALAELRAGRMVVLVDDENRENEGDLVIAAQKVTADAVNFMVRNGCGILGLSLSSAICDQLDLEPLAGKNVDPQATPWTPHIDARTRPRPGRRTSTPAPASPPARLPSTAPAPFRSPSMSAPRRPT